MSASTRLESVTSRRITFKFFANHLMGRHFIVDLNDLPIEHAREIVVQRKSGRTLHQYSLSWRRFLHQTCIGSVALIPWSAFTHKERKVQKK